MTVSVQSSQSIFLGNGVTTTFTFTWQWESSAYIEVSFTNASGVQTILTPSQYVLVLNPPATGELWGTGGTVQYPTMGAAIANGTSLTVRRTVPFSQPTQVSNQTSYPVAVETALDNLAFQIQELANRTGQFRGTWITGVYYNYGDVVVDGANGANTGNYYMCTLANTSGTWATDLAAGDWTLIINISTTAINASLITQGVLSQNHGGAGTVNGILKANGSGIVSAAVANTDFQSPIVLTTTGTSGAATFNGTALNVPQYSSNPGSGTVTSVTFTGDGVVLSAMPSAAVTTSGTVTCTLVAATAKSLLGNPTAGSLAPVYTTSPVVSGAMTAASLIPTGSAIPTNGLYLPSASLVGISNQGVRVAFFASSGTGADYVGMQSQSAGLGAIVSAQSSGTNASLSLTALGTGSVLIASNNTGTTLATFANSGAATLNVAGATWTAGSFTVNSATAPVNGLYLPAASVPGIASNSILVAGFYSPGAGGDYLLFKNVAASGLSAIAAPTACTIALAGGGAGNLSTGNYTYRITFVGTLGETPVGSISNTVTVAAPGSNGKIALTGIQLSGSGTVTARNIYRTVANGSIYFLVSQISDNTTTSYTDNVADAGLGYSAPTSQGQLPTYVVVGNNSSTDTSVGVEYRALGTTTTGYQYNGMSAPGGLLTTGTHDFYCNNTIALRVTDNYYNPNQTYGGAPQGYVVISSGYGSSSGTAEAFCVVSAELTPAATASSATLRLNSKGINGQIDLVTNGYVNARFLADTNSDGNNKLTDSYAIVIQGVTQDSGTIPSISLQSTDGVFDSPQDLLFNNKSTGGFVFQSNDALTTILTMVNAGTVTVNTGNLVIGTAGKGLVLKRGANAKCGTFVLTGTAPVTVSNTSIAITDGVIVSLNTVGGTVGATPSVKTITAATGFTIAGTALDTSTYNYNIISNAA